MTEHRIRLSTSERGYVASCACGWRITRDRRARRDAEAEQHDRTSTAPAQRPGRYVCREHPDQAVTWRGTGCPDCAAETVHRREQFDTEPTW